MVERTRVDSGGLGVCTCAAMREGGQKKEGGQQPKEISAYKI